MLQTKYVPFELFHGDHAVCTVICVDEGKVPCIQRVHCACHGERDFDVKGGKVTLCGRAFRWSDVTYEVDADGSKRAATQLDDYMFDPPRQVAASSRDAKSTPARPARKKKEREALKKGVRDACRSLMRETRRACAVFNEVNDHLTLAARLLSPAFATEGSIAHAMGCERVVYNKRFQRGSAVRAVRVAERGNQDVVLAAYAEDGSSQEFACGGAPRATSRPSRSPRRTSTNPPPCRDRSCSSPPSP